MIGMLECAAANLNIICCALHFVDLSACSWMCFTYTKVANSLLPVNQTAPPPLHQEILF